MGDVLRLGAVALVVAVGCSTDRDGLLADGGASNGDGPYQSRVDAPASCSAAPAGNKTLGQVCTCPGDCSSGFCVDNVCCNKACDGVCQACNVAGTAGACTPLPAGVRPVIAGQCQTADVSTCGLDGTCDGYGGCRKYPDGTECKAGNCEGSSVVGAMACQGGACKAGPSTLCTPYQCDPATKRCFQSCAGNSQCDNRTCEAGSCGKKPLGAVCGGSAECDSGSCADGVCCNLACSGACVSCNQPGKMGECRPVAVKAADPHGLCKADRPESCGLSGLCNGQGGCAKFEAGTICKPGSCSGGSQIPASTCNGVGVCLLGTAITCFPFVCAGTACKAVCGANGDCATGNVCMNPGATGSCGKKGLGQKCAAAAECKSNLCVDGVCCDQACGGSCAYCAFPNSPGRCVAVPAAVPDPRGACVDRGPASCGTDGKCNGARACALYATGTVCKQGSCDGASNRVTSDSVCRNGMCTAPAPTSCAPFRCNGSRCGTSCSTNEMCAPPSSCQEGSCGKRPNGAVCARAVECASGFCAQGVCCGSACTASCFSCALEGSKGACTVVPAGGPDPAGRCPDQGPASCGNDGFCNGAGACRKYPVGTTCAAASCASGTFTGPATCNASGVCAGGATSLCAPFVCNPGGTACFGSCSDDAQCIPGRQCEMGLCGRKENGATCNDRDECRSSFCVDSVCCDSDCAGVCKSCSVANLRGTCSNIPPGNADDGGGCAAAAESTCGNDGFCNGAGACRKWGTSTVCRAAICPASATTVTNAARCDGAGTCPAGDMQSCGNFKCDPVANACKTTCASDADCNGKACDLATGSCGKSLLGAHCTMGSECASGNCVDSTCCSSPSCGTCQSCGNDNGACAPVADNQADADSCSDETSMSTCGSTGKCDGAGHCKTAAAGTGCGNVCSPDKTSVVARTCDGSGMCTGSGNTTSCRGFECAGGACPDTCDPLTNAGCIPGKVCLNNTCQDPLPEPPPDQDGGSPSR